MWLSIISSYFYAVYQWLHCEIKECWKGVFLYYSKTVLLQNLLEADSLMYLKLLVDVLYTLHWNHIYITDELVFNGPK